MNWKAHMACHFNCLIESEGLVKSQAVAYTVSVDISWKWCKIQALLLQTTSELNFFNSCYCHMLAWWL